MQILSGNQVGLPGAGEAGGNPEHRTGWFDNRDAMLLLIKSAV
jgi:hypothetical protein